MEKTILLLGILLATTSASHAQVVMLPTQQQFRYRGSVLVPDRGTTSLGGNSYYGSAASRRGFMPAGSSRGASAGTSGMSISTTIIDHQEIDRQLLGGTPEEFLNRQRAEERREQARARGPARPLVDAARPANTSVEEGKALVRYARRLHAEGKSERSKAVYRLAMPLLTPHLRTLATQEYKRVFVATVAQSSGM